MVARLCLQRQAAGIFSFSMFCLPLHLQLNFDLLEQALPHPIGEENDSDGWQNKKKA